jgi:hypothetical protein
MDGGLVDRMVIVYTALITLWHAVADKCVDEARKLKSKTGHHQTCRKTGRFGGLVPTQPGARLILCYCGVRPVSMNDNIAIKRLAAPEILFVTGVVGWLVLSYATEIIPFP